MFGSDKEIKILVKMIDETKETQQSIMKRLNEMEQGTGKTALSLGNLTKANFLADLAMKGFTATLSLAQQGVSTLWDSLQKGADLDRIKVATETLGQNMGYTTEQINGMVDALEDSNTYGSNAYKTIQTMTQSGLLPFIKNLDKTKGKTGDLNSGFNKFILTVKDMGASFGTSSDQAIDAFTKFVATGRSELVEAYGINKSLITVYEEYAVQLGKNAQDLTEVEKNQARLNLVMSEGAKYAGVYSKTYETAGKNLLSIGSASQSAMETFGSAFQDALQPVTEDILNFIKGVRKYFSGEEFKTFADNFNKTFVSVYENLKELPNKIGAIFSALNMDDLDMLSDAFKNLVGEDAYNSLKGFFDWFSSVLFGLKSLGEGFSSTFTPIFSVIADVVNTELMPALKELWTSIMGVFGSSNQTNGEDFIKIMREIGKVLGAIVGGALIGLIKGITLLAQGLKWVFDGVSALIPIVKQWAIDFVTGVQNVIAWFQALPTNISNTFNEVLASIGNFVAGVIAGFMAFGETIRQELNKIITINGIGIADFLGQEFSKIATGITDTATQFFGFLGGLFDNFKNFVGNAISTVWNTLGGWANTIGTWVNTYIVKPFNDAWTNVAKFFTDVFDGIKKTINDFFSGVNTSVNNIGTVMKGFINSLIDGMNNMLKFGFDVLGNRIEIDLPDIPKLATGTNYVPNDTLAYIHKGEAVVPAKYNPSNPSSMGSGGGGNTFNFNAPIIGIDNLEQVLSEAIEKAQASANRRATYNLSY